MAGYRELGGGNAPSMQTPTPAPMLAEFMAKWFLCQDGLKKWDQMVSVLGCSEPLRQQVFQKRSSLRKNDNTLSLDKGDIRTLPICREIDVSEMLWETIL